MDISKQRFSDEEHDMFGKALESASDMYNDPNFDRYVDAESYKKAQAKHGVHPSVNPPQTDIWPRLPDSSDQGDPFGSKVKPKNVKVWTKKPSTDEEWAIYKGLHIHTEDNPLGLHTHIPGGTLGGGHTHGPQNRFGVHHHKEINEDELTITSNFNLDGHHTHEDGENFPCGDHKHDPENFG
jgi:hypothetical protein